MDFFINTGYYDDALNEIDEQISFQKKNNGNKSAKIFELQLRKVEVKLKKGDIEGAK